MSRRASWLASLAIACAAVGCAPRASEPAKEALPADRDPAALVQRGKDYAENGDLVRAEQYLSAALAWGANENEVLPMLLKVCVAARHYRLAAEYAEAALARSPQNARLRFLAGALYVQIGEGAKARERLEAAARDMPDNPEVQFTVAVFFRDELTDRIAADPYFREYLRLAPTGAHVPEARASVMERVE